MAWCGQKKERKKKSIKFYKERKGGEVKMVEELGGCGVHHSLQKHQEHIYKRTILREKAEC